MPNKLMPICSAQLKLIGNFQIDNHVKDIMGYISSGNPDNPTTSKITYVDIRRFFLLKSGTFYLSKKKLDYLHPEGFPQIRV